MDNKQKDEQINDFINELSEERPTPEELNAFFKELISQFKTIYTDDYRHSYSKMYAAISTVNDNNSLDSLGTNTEMFRDYINNLEGNAIDDNVKKGIYKFIDHVTLECSRMGHFNVIQNKYDHEQADHSKLKDDHKKLRKDADELDNRIEILKQEVHNQSKDILSHMITVISIFTAIVFTALTSFNLITSIASAVAEQGNYYWVGCVLVTVAFITINLFYILLRFIGRLIDKTIFAHKNYIVTLNIILGVIIVVLFALSNQMLYIH